MKKIALNTLNKIELAEFFTNLNEKKFRADQLFHSVHKHMVFDINDVKGFSNDLKEKISQHAYIKRIKLITVLSSKIDKTKKFLFELEDGQVIESVFMSYDGRNTICVSCQVGCKMGCKFCASTKAGFVRHLSVAEILSQLYMVERELDEKINNIVFMGIGEPLDNYDNIVKTIEILNHEDGKNMSQRNMTLSTSGLVPKIYELADLKLAINLAVSFHYPFNEERSSFMPVNQSYNIESLIEACDYYFEKTGRRVSYEYLLVQGLNDTQKHGEELIKLFAGKNIHINLIGLNEIDEFNYKSSNSENMIRFRDQLQKKGLNATIRQSKGIDIDGACGQLRVNYIGEEP